MKRQKDGKTKRVMGQGSREEMGKGIRSLIDQSLIDQSLIDQKLIDQEFDRPDIDRPGV